MKQANSVIGTSFLLTMFSDLKRDN